MDTFHKKHFFKIYNKNKFTLSDKKRRINTRSFRNYVNELFNRIWGNNFFYREIKFYTLWTGTGYVLWSNGKVLTSYDIRK